MKPAPSRAADMLPVPLHSQRLRLHRRRRSKDVLIVMKGMMRP